MAASKPQETYLKKYYLIGTVKNKQELIEVSTGELMEAQGSQWKICTHYRHIPVDLSVR